CVWQPRSSFYYAGSFRSKETGGHVSCSATSSRTRVRNPADSMRTQGARPARRRFVRVAIVAAALAVLAYPVLVNVLLAVGGVQKMFDDTDTVKVDFRRAWSFWPGQVYVDD